MINIPNKITPPLNQNQIFTLNNKITQPLTKDTVKNLNAKQLTAMPQSQQRAAFNAAPQYQQRTVVHPEPQCQPRSTAQTFTQQRTMPQSQTVPAFRTSTMATTSVPSRPTVQPRSMSSRSTAASRPAPKLLHPLQKGQKISLAAYTGNLRKIRVCFGWNVLDSRCDMDASAFLLGANGRVMSDEWLVFYNQPESPDGSTRFLKQENGVDREQICIDLGALNPAIQRIVFVLTIDEAFSHNLNFSMISNAYIRLVNEADNQEIVSFSLAEYYSNVTSMTMAELYIHNGQWKFNPVGNGVHQDLAGQCRIYGVEIG